MSELAGGAVLCFDEVQVLWGHGHDHTVGQHRRGFPVEAAFEEERAPSVAGALEAGFYSIP
jgi:hypothetical protein